MLGIAIIPWAFLTLFLSFVWKHAKAFILKSPLDKIPGPKRQSLAKGEYQTLSEYARE